ncbi:MAG: hypothetical protein ACFFAN_08480 [Promethearchaeota archaeon]
MSQNCDKFSNESEIYSKILEIFFSEEGEETNLKEIWKNKSIIELMNNLKQNKDKVLAKNALILLLSLFDDAPPDCFSTRGNKLSKLSKEDKELAKSKLKEVFPKID